MTIRSGDWIALYGSLLRGLDGLAQLGLTTSEDGNLIYDGTGRAVLAYAGDCVIAGRLFDLGAYPGLRHSDPELRHGDGRVLGEAFTLLEPSLADDLDRFEGFNPEARAESLYLREWVELLAPDRQSAWVYIYNHEPPQDTRIVSGDWRTHIEHRASNPSGL